MLNQVTIGLFAYDLDDKLGFFTVTKFALPQKIFEPTVQRIKVKLPALFPRKNSDSSMFPHALFLRLNPPYSMWALPSGWDNPHLTRK